MQKSPTIDQVKSIIESRRAQYSSIIRTKYPELYSEVSSKYNGKTFKEKLYRYLNNDKVNLGKCPNCGHDCKFDSIFDGFLRYCSSKCSNSSPEVQQSKKLSYLKKYGVDNPSKATVVKEKKKETCIAHFGVDCNLSCEDTKNKMKQTNLKKYGTEYPLQNELIFNKVRNTNLEKYRVEFVSQVDKFKEQIKKTNMGRYGATHPLQCKDVHEKLENTNLERYGVKHFAQSDVYKKNVWSKFYEKLISSKRLNGEMIPLFSVNDYKGVEKKYKFKCLKCQNIFEDHLQDGRIPRCYNCYPKLFISWGEVEIMEFIRSLDNTLIIEFGHRMLQSGKELDVYIPDKKLAIEFDGLYWHSETGGNKHENYHLNKTVECETMGIHLIHIFEDEWMNTPDIVKSRIASILQKTPNVIYARKCEIRLVSSDESSDFLDDNHLQGKDNNSIKLGLYHNDELLSIMTFGNLRKCMDNNAIDNHYEMYRFCSKINYSVVGAASKLLKHFIQNYNPEKIISYADRRWSRGNLYEKIGFTKVSILRPNYFYTMDHCKKYHKFSFRKSELSAKLSIFDPNLSEWENMQLNGWDRIWDCGSLKYEWNNPKKSSDVYQ